MVIQELTPINEIRDKLGNVINILSTSAQNYLDEFVSREDFEQIVGECKYRLLKGLGELEKSPNMKKYDDFLSSIKKDYFAVDWNDPNSIIDFAGKYTEKMRKFYREA